MLNGQCRFLSITIPSLSLSLSATKKTLSNSVTYQVLLVIGIMLVVIFSLLLCMWCYAKPTRKRRFFKRLFKRRSEFDNEPLLVLDDDDEPVLTESKEGYFV